MAMLMRKALLTPIRFGTMPSSFSSVGLRGSTPHSRDVEFIQNKIPKRMNPFSLFFKDHFASVKQVNTGKPIKEIFRICSQDFKALSPEKMQKYKTAGDKSLEAYRKARKSLTNKEREILRIERKAVRARKTSITAVKNLNKLKKDYGYPDVKGSTGIMLLGADKEAELKGLKTVVEKGRKLGELWNKLSNAEKKKYAEKSAIARAERNSALKKWEEDMKKKGNESILQHMRELKKMRRVAKISLNKLSQGIDNVKPKKLIKKISKRGRIGLKTKPKSKRGGLKTKSSRIGLKTKPRRVGLKAKSVLAKKSVGSSKPTKSVVKATVKSTSIPGKKKSPKKGSDSDSD